MTVKVDFRGYREMRSGGRVFGTCNNFDVHDLWWIAIF